MASHHEAVVVAGLEEDGAEALRRHLREGFERVVGEPALGLEERVLLRRKLRKKRFTRS